MSVLVIIEHNNAELKPSNLAVLSAALTINEPVDVAVIGYQCAAVVTELQQFGQIQTIHVVDHADCQTAIAEIYAPIIVKLASNYDYVLMPATTFGKNILPRVAATLDVQMISDVIAIEDKKVYQRPIYAGNAIATIESLDDKQLLTIRTTAFAAIVVNSAQTPAVNAMTYTASATPAAKFVKAELHQGDRPELTAAEVVISGGRGLKDKASFERLTAIADRMGAAIGASRAAVDAGLAPNDYQVGQTGQVVAPKLYFAVGISGAIQHLAGMKDSKIIVAINKDPDAPIFQVADYGLVADLFTVLPEWEAMLKEGK